MQTIDFYSHYPSFKKKFSSSFRQFILSIFKEEKKLYKNISLSFHFFTDKDLLQLNKEILQHNFYTDIITCPIIQSNDYLEADIYISIDRVYDNANKLKQSFNKELHRVIFHGVLHLCGYKDKTEAEEALMREKENYYLNKCFT